MKRFFVNQITDAMTLTGDNHKHLSLVLRARIGERVILCPQDGADYLFEITDIGKQETRLRFIEKRINDKEPKVCVTVFSALMKGDKNEWAAQKLTELGVSEIVPFRSAFTVTRPSDKHRDRLSRVCEEAAKQCGRANVPVVGPDSTFKAVTERLNRFDLVVFPYENARDLDIKTYLRQRPSDVRTAALVIGAEGGFSPEEAEILSRFAPPVTLGKRVLRAETANVAAAAILMYELGELK